MQRHRPKKRRKRTAVINKKRESVMKLKNHIFISPMILLHLAYVHKDTVIVNVKYWILSWTILCNVLDICTFEAIFLSTIFLNKLAKTFQESSIALKFYSVLFVLPKLYSLLNFLSLQY